MRNFMSFSQNLVNSFEGKEENAVAFTALVNNAAHGIYEQYSKDETQSMIRAQFDRILGIDWATATPMKRRQAWRDHGKELYTIIEDTIADKLVSGWGDDPFFMQFVEDKNLALGDKNEFYVDENSVMNVSKFAGNHHDVKNNRIRIA